MTAVIAEQMYAVSVRDNEELFLILRIRRNRRGEIFCMFPRPGREGWDPHASYHLDGKYHHKSFDHKMIVTQGPPLDQNFCGSINLLTTSIKRPDVRAINVICNPDNFDKMLEIPVDEISEDNKVQTSITIDITEPGLSANIIRGSRLVDQLEINDRHPSILITVSAFKLAN